MVSGDNRTTGAVSRAKPQTTNMPTLSFFYRPDSILIDFPFSASILLVGRQEGHLGCKKTGCWFVGGDNLTAALHVS